MRTAARLLVIALMLTLAACGWRLRGQGVGSLEGISLFVDTAIVEADVRTPAVRGIRMAGGTLAEAPDQAEAVLVLLSETIQQQAVSISAAARAQEYEISYGLRYRLEASVGQVLIPDETVWVSEVYQYDSRNVLSSQARAATVTERLRQNAVRLLLPRVEAALRQPARE
jgi:LPS-assembly lipoprotein